MKTKQKKQACWADWQNMDFIKQKFTEEELKEIAREHIKQNCAEIEEEEARL